MKTAEQFHADHAKLVGATVGTKRILPACQYVLKRDKKKNLVLCGHGSEAEYRVASEISSIMMCLCSKHATDLQQQHTNWKFYRQEK